MLSPYLSRRGFISSLAAGAAGGVLADLLPAKAAAANDVLQVGCIGTGGRCRYLMQRLQKMPDVRITAVADVWDVSLAEGKKMADEKATAVKDYRKLLERSDVDAVVIATPDHWHVPITIDACAAGKDVYVEKPLTHDLSEGAKVIEAQKKHERVVQVGVQQRSMPQFQKGREIVQSGQLGKIHKVHLTWNRNAERWSRTPLGVDPSSVDWPAFLGNAPEQPFDEYRFRHWRWFWDFGGGIFTDLMVHQLDIANWYLGLTSPTMAASIGDHFQAKDVWETPDTVQTLLRYPEQEVQVYFEGTFASARNAAMIELMGTEATLYLDRGRYELIPERRSKLAPSEMIIGSGPRGADFYDDNDGEMYHLRNWIECIHSRGKPNADVESGVQVAAAAHLANQSYRSQAMAWGAE